MTALAITAALAVTILMAACIHARRLFWEWARELAESDPTGKENVE